MYLADGSPGFAPHSNQGGSLAGDFHGTPVGIPGCFVGDYHGTYCGNLARAAGECQGMHACRPGGFQHDICPGSSSHHDKQWAAGRERDGRSNAHPAS